MFRLMLTATIALLMSVAIAQKSYYFRAEADCLNRLEYVSSDAGAPYVSYSHKLGDRNFIVLDVGVESSKWVQALPGKLTYCNGIKIDAELVRAINDGSVQFFIVRESPTHYHVAKVGKAAQIDAAGEYLNYTAEDGSFSVKLDNPTTGVNLAMPGSKVGYYLREVTAFDCFKGFVFQKRESSNSKTFKEYVAIPEYGIVERRSVTSVFLADEVNSDIPLKLRKVNDSTFKDLVAEACAGLQAKYYDKGNNNSTVPAPYEEAVQPKGGGKTPSAPSSAQGKPTSVSASDNPCAPSTEPGVHIVQKGETLYALAKKYGVTVQQLQTWNNISNSFVISLCQKLLVKEPQSNSGGQASTSNPSSSGNNKGAEGYWTKPTGEHTVKKGETVASIAKMYGYTEERFRKMNGLGTTETLLIGQRLHTNDCVCPTLDSSTKDAPLPYEEQVTIPKQTMEEEQKAASSNPNNIDVFYRPILVHEVSSDDTIFSVAKKYNTTAERIQELNGLTKNDKLVVGQRIYVQ